MNLIDQLNWRYATKRMNGTKVPQEKIERILEAIRLAPTSYGFQAFKVFVIESPELLEQISPAAYNQPQIKEASHLLVFAAIQNIDAQQADDYVAAIAATRNKTVESLSGMRAMFDGLVAAESNFAWTSRQTYIALGFGLIAAAIEEVDATPMEGFNNEALDKILGLTEQNLSSVSILPLGYRDAENDHLASAAKVRKSKEELFVTI
jgi:nitroreductase